MFKKFFSSKNKEIRYFDNFSNFGEFFTQENNPYKTNVIVYRCVNLISQSASHVPWIICNKQNGVKEALPNHPIGRILSRPNPRYAGADFFQEVISSLLLFGNSYILGVKRRDKHELHILNPKNMDIILEGGALKAYRHRQSGKDTLYHIDNITLASNVLHLKTYNPSDSLYGLPALDAANTSINTHNLATKWNHSLLKNGARPSGALVMREGYLSDEQFLHLKDQLTDRYSGSSNSGKPLLLEGGLEWQEMSISPKDMDFVESKNSSAREIALAFGVPPQLLGINGDNTYSNMQEARFSLWEETIIPLLDKISDALTYWFQSLMHEDIIIDFDRNAISALTEKRENLWSKISESKFMTINEKRIFMGLDAISGGDKLDA